MSERITIRPVATAARRGLARFAADERAAVAMLFGLLLLPLLLAVATSVDFLRAHDARGRMQAALDAALIAAIKKIDRLDQTALERVIGEWLAAQDPRGGFVLTRVAIDRGDATIRADARLDLPTTIMRAVGIDALPIAVSSTVIGPLSSYLNIHLLLDNTGSMLLPATTTGRDAMKTGRACQFACHTCDGTCLHGISNYTYARNHAIRLRTDVVLDAARALLDLVDEIDSGHTRIAAGLIRIDETATQTLAPTTNTATVRAGLTETLATDGSYFELALPRAATLVGPAGDGRSADHPLQLAMIVTDGVQSYRHWVVKNAATLRYVTPLNPAWCDQLKQNGVTVAVLYTRYLPITGDWGYEATLGSSMASSGWTSQWGGVPNPAVSTATARVDYLPIALQDCASSPSLVITADAESEIAAGMRTLLSRYLSAVRFTR